MLLLTLSGCGAATERSSLATDSRPHVLVVMLDSCRADKLGAWGFDRPTSPRLDELTRDADAVRFAWHIAQAPHTKASTASLFTGRYPFQHGVIVKDLLSELELRSGRYQDLAIAAGYKTLPEAFREAGYRTAVLSAIAHVAAESGFSRGVDRFVSGAPGVSDRSYADQALDFLEQDDRPAFAYLHLRACHNPFPPWRRDSAYAASFVSTDTERDLRSRGIDVGDLDFKLSIRRDELRLSPAETEFLHAVYESVLRRVDHRLTGMLIDELRRRGLYDRTLLCISADHGEELLDHGNYAHGHAVWNEIVRVPLLVKFPKGRRPPELGQTVSGVTEAIGLHSGLLRQAGIAPPAGAPSSNTFDPERQKGVAFTQAPESWALFEWPWKLVVSQPEKRASLFDIERDPRETLDLAASKPEVVARLLGAGRRLQQGLPRMEAIGGSRRTEVSEETIEQLRSLGYLN